MGPMAPTKKGVRKAKAGVSFEDVRRLALALPEVKEGPSYGTPGFRVKGKLFARLKEDGQSLVVWVEDGLKEVLLESNPRVYFTTDHYVGYDLVLVRLPEITLEELSDRLLEAWRLRAPRRVLDAWRKTSTT